MSVSEDVIVLTGQMVPQVVSGQFIPPSAATYYKLSGHVPLAVGVIVKALPGNSGTVYVGGQGTSSINGFPLAKSEVVFVPLSWLDQLTVASATSGDGIAYIGG